MTERVKHSSHHPRKPQEHNSENTRHELSNSMLTNEFVTPSLLKSANDLYHELESKHLKSFAKSKHITHKMKYSQDDLNIERTTRSIIRDFGRSSYVKVVTKDKASQYHHHKPHEGG